MEVDRILCLANSYKHENRCVAGISLITRKWVRLVGRCVPGCLTARETCYPDGREAAILDVFEVEIGKACGSNAHPEDVEVAGTPWKPLRRFDQPPDARFFQAYLDNGPAVLQGFGDRVYERRFDNQKQASLQLIRGENLWWWIREENGKRKNRALFRKGSTLRACYDLAVTDPAWLDKLRTLAPGIYTHASFFVGKPPRTVLTVSLSEAFEHFHYKLIAGVVMLFQ